DMKRARQHSGEVMSRQAHAAFSKIGVLMASAGRNGGKPLHPTNIHVKKELYPDDTVQSRLPEPAWLEQWLDRQIRFDGEWENKVSGRILHNLSLLLNRSFSTVQDLSRYRTEAARRLADLAEPEPLAVA